MSLEEFLESCRATSLLAELQDDDDLPDADDNEEDMTPHEARRRELGFHHDVETTA